MEIGLIICPDLIEKSHHTSNRGQNPAILIVDIQ
jgi:hypothetical protein